MIHEQVKQIIVENPTRQGLISAMKYYIDALGLKKYIAMEVGSVVVFGNQDKNLFNGKTDYDILVIYDASEQHKLSQIFPKEVIDGKIADILCDNIRYGKNKNCISIHFYSTQVTEKLIELKPVNLKIFRTYPATESRKAKGEAIVYHDYYNDMNLDCEKRELVEMPYLDGNVLQYTTNPLEHNKIKLASRHIILLFNNLLFESNAGLYIGITTKFKKNVQRYLAKSNSQQDFLHFFQYYRNKITDQKQLKEFDEKMITAFFYRK